MFEPTEVDGVPALVVPMPGPLTAGLTFRVGRADETLARAGITHLVEHLALHRHGITDYHFNGATGSVVTHFHMRGSEEDVVGFLTGVCDSLADLPVDRLEAEKALLRAEAQGRVPGVNEMMPLWRYGARDHGLVSFPEWGLHGLGAADVREWAETWFTRGNAVLWIAGPGVPTGLTLRLREGARRPVPPPSSALPQTPAYFTGDRSGVVFDGVVRRGAEATVFAAVLNRDLFRSLRQEGGYSYTTGASYNPRGDGFAVVTAVADAVADKPDAVLGGFVDVLAAMRVGRIDPADLDAAREAAEKSLRDPDAAADRLPGYAMNLLTGHPVLEPEEVLAGIRAVTADDVRAAAVEAFGTGLLQVPEGHRADWAAFTAAPFRSAEAAAGTTYACLDDGGGDLILGREGASLVGPHGPATVRFDDCAAVLRWPDGARQLVGGDAITVRIEPTLYQLDAAALAALDAATPPAAAVTMPARPADAIPVPRPRPAAPRAGRTALETLAMILFGGLAGLVGSLAAVSTLATVVPPAGEAEDFRGAGWYLILVVLWLVTFALAGPALMLARRLFGWPRRRART